MSSMTEDQVKSILLSDFNSDLLNSSGFSDLIILQWDNQTNANVEAILIVRFQLNISINTEIYTNLSYEPNIKNISRLNLCSNESSTTTTTQSPTTTNNINISTVSPTSKSKKSCTFISRQLSSNLTKIINRRCREIFSYRKQDHFGKKLIAITNKRCGLEMTSNLTEAERSPLCYSYIDNQLNLTLIHVLRVQEILYISDFANIEKSSFRSLKNSIEREYNDLILDKSRFLNMGFDRAIFLSIEKPSSQNKSSRKKRDVGLGVEVSLAVQFTKNNVDVDNYERNFNLFTDRGKKLGDNKLDPSHNRIERIQSCNESFETLFKDMDDEILSASGINNKSQRGIIPIGSTIDLKCPPGKKFSFDEDGFVQNDGIYQVICMSHAQFKIPAPNWPKCVKFCPLKLPNPPSHTGLKSVIPEFTPPAGENGKYECIKSDLGVDRGASPYYEVECLNSTLYKLPIAKYDWPVCEEKTTTIRPEIPIGINNMLSRYTWNINYRYTQYQSDSNFIPKEMKDYFTLITVPCFFGILAIILLCLCLTRNDSPICVICKDSTLRKKKTLIPVQDNERN